MATKRLAATITSGGETWTTHFQGSNAVIVTQIGCEVTFVTIHPTEGPLSPPTRGTLSGNQLIFKASDPLVTFIQPASNLVFTENRITSSHGTVSEGKLNFTCDGVVKGTLDGQPFTAVVSGEADMTGDIHPLGPPNIVIPPASQAVMPGSPVTLSVGASGGCLNYQWRKNFSTIPGATGSTHAIANAQSTDTAMYDVVIWNNYGLAASSPANVSVCNRTLPAITVQPQNTQVQPGEMATFSVEATGTCLQYQWRKDFENIPDATGSAYQTDLAFENATYDVVVWNVYGDIAASQPASLDVCSSFFTIVNEPNGMVLAPGDTAIFAVEVSGGCVQYQWRKNSTNIPGATASSFTIPNVQGSHAGNYNVTVSSPLWSETTTPVSLVVCTQTLSQTLIRFTAEGGTDLVDVVTPGDCGWSADNANSWVSIVQEGGFGNGSFTVTAIPNTNDSPRVGYLRVNGQILTLVQAGSLVPVALERSTLHMTFSNSVTPFLLHLDAGTYRRAPIAPLELPGGTFTCTRGETTAEIILSEGITINLEFATHRNGTFTQTVGEDTLTGTFILGESGPDFAGDHLPDLMLQRTNGAIAGWSMNGTNFLKGFLFNPNKPRDGWRLCGQGDFNGDGKTDVLMQHKTHRTVAVFLMNGTNQITGRMLKGGVATALGWRVVGAADFSHDGKPDVLLQHDTGKAALWLMDGTNFVSGKTLRHGGSPGAAWKIVGTGDFDGDLQTDILLQHTDGRTAVWFFVGSDYVNTQLLRTTGAEHALGWRVRGASDLNNDGSADVLLENVMDRRVVGWLFQQKTFQNAVQLRTIAPGWNVVGPR